MSSLGTPSISFTHTLQQEALKALRSGMPLETVIASLVHQAETLQASLPVVTAMREAGRNPG